MVLCSESDVAERTAVNEPLSAQAEEDSSILCSVTSASEPPTVKRKVVTMGLNTSSTELPGLAVTEAAISARSMFG